MAASAERLSNDSRELTGYQNPHTHILLVMLLIQMLDRFPCVTLSHIESRTNGDSPEKKREDKIQTEVQKPEKLPTMVKVCILLSSLAKTGLLSHIESQMQTVSHLESQSVLSTFLSVRCYYCFL